MHLEDEEREERWILDRLRLLDHPMPPISFPAHRRHGPAWHRWAAGILLTLAVAGAAYAFPGSPLRSWIAGLTSSRAPEVRGPSATPTTPDRPSAISLPLESRLVIRWVQSDPASTIRVRLTDGNEVVVSSLRGTAAFTTGPGRLSIGSPGEYLVELPRKALWVAVEAGDRRLLLKEGDRVTSSVVADSTGAYTFDIGTRR